MPANSPRGLGGCSDSWRHLSWTLSMRSSGGATFVAASRAARTLAVRVLGERDGDGAKATGGRFGFGAAFVPMRSNGGASFCTGSGATGLVDGAVLGDGGGVGVTAVAVGFLLSPSSRIWPAGPNSCGRDPGSTGADGGEGDSVGVAGAVAGVAVTGAVGVSVCAVTGEGGSRIRQVATAATAATTTRPTATIQSARRPRCLAAAGTSLARPTRIGARTGAAWRPTSAPVCSGSSSWFRFMAWIVSKSPM